jgi:hypothetical protein
MVRWRRIQRNVLGSARIGRGEVQSRAGRLPAGGAAGGGGSIFDALVSQVSPEPSQLKTTLMFVGAAVIAFVVALIALFGPFVNDEIEFRRKLQIAQQKARLAIEQRDLEEQPATAT